MRSFLFLISLLAVMTLATARAVAMDNDYVAILQGDAADKALWERHEWLNLLHYQRSRFAENSFTSSVDDPQFFFSANGKTSPRNEMNATLAAFFKEQDTGNEHAICRFPARLNWLVAHLGIDRQRLPAVECSDYAEWRERVHAGSATLIFPTYQLNSPSSMFGHTLLRLDPVDKDNWSDWLSYAVNFGANISNDDNSLTYVWNGLTGGYPGQFIVMPYFRKIQEYNRIEKRDIWEYRLNLTPEEVGLLTTHLWELKDINFDYYFFTENCSYRLLELLEIARPGVELTDEFVVTAIPVDTVRAIERAGMVDKASYRPSQETIAKKMIRELPEEDYDRLDRVLDQPIADDDRIFQSLPAERQKALFNTAYKLLRLRQNRKQRDPLVARKSHQLLTLLNHYPQAGLPDVQEPVRPESGHHSKRVTFGALRRRGKAYSELGFRMAFHSLEDDDAGYLRGAQINIANFIVRRKSSSGSIVLQQADFADIFSLTPRSRYFNPISWRVRGGLERVFSDGDDRTVGHISGGGGFAWQALEDGTAYTLLTGRLETNSTFTHRIEPALGVSVGGTYSGRIGTGRVEFNGEKFTGGEYRLNLSFTQNMVIARDHALQFHFKREWHTDDNFGEVGLVYHYFF